jgi:spore coat polysaccharide biosynthesis protein SpsF
MIGVVVQARLGSTRLPGKALLPLGDATLTDQVLRRLALVPADVRVLATDEASAAAFAGLAGRNGFELLVGPAEDVLARYCLALRRFGLDMVVRATGDNPLVAHELATLLLKEAAEAAGGHSGKRGRADYSAQLGMPLGMGVELVSAEALYRAEAEATSPYEREHVCPYLYGHPELFTLVRSQAPEDYQMEAARVTVDTPEDYERMKEIYAGLYDGRPIPSLAVLAWLRAQGEKQC